MVTHHTCIAEISRLEVVYHVVVENPLAHVLCFYQVINPIYTT